MYPSVFNVTGPTRRRPFMLTLTSLESPVNRTPCMFLGLWEGVGVKPTQTWEGQANSMQKDPTVDSNARPSCHEAMVEVLLLLHISIFCWAVVLCTYSRRYSEPVAHFTGLICNGCSCRARLWLVCQEPVNQSNSCCTTSTNQHHIQIPHRTESKKLLRCYVSCIGLTLFKWCLSGQSWGHSCAHASSASEGLLQMMRNTTAI